MEVKATNEATTVITTVEGEPVDVEMLDFLALPPIPTISIEERLEHIETSILKGFEHINDFKESINSKFEEI